MPSPHNSQRSLRTFSLAMMVCLVSFQAGSAGTYRWDDPTGGFYGHKNNWNPTPLIMPGANDEVVFDINNTYTVVFSSSGTTHVQNQAATFEDGNVTFDLSNSQSATGESIYEALSTSGSGLLVTTKSNPGSGGGTYTRFTIEGGEFRTQADSVINSAIDQHSAQLTVSAGGLLNVLGDYLRVATTNHGRVRVEDGGELRTRSVTIGEDGYHLPYADGNITVTGAASLWNTGSMFIAGSSTNDGGFGSVSISNDATVKANGIVKLWTDADVYLSGGLLEVSLFDDCGGDVHWTGGTLRILNQLTELDALKLLGDDVSIYSGKRLEHRRDLKVGKDGPAVMRLSGTGSARVGYGAASDKTTLGYSGTVEGSLLIEGPQTEWNGNVHVGGSDDFDGGIGNLMVSGGANENVGNLDVALNDGASGNVDLVDAGTLWTASDVVIGNRGVATFNVLDDATLETATLDAADGSLSSASITIDGNDSRVRVYPGATNRTSRIAKNGFATLSITEGGLLEMVNTVSILADEPGSQAVVAVNGRGVGGPSRWSTNRPVTLAKYGSGELHVANEGYVEHDAIVIVAEQAGSNVTINVDGPGSEYRPKFLTLSGAGTSVLNVTNGGAVVSEEVFSATEIEGTATINVDGAGSSLIVNAVDLDDLNLADQGVTTLRVTSGGHVGAGNIRVAQLGTGQGTIDIRGGSTLQSRTLEVGYGGSGTMTVAEQGGVDTFDEASVGRNVGSQGNVVVDGVASRWTSGNLYVGGNDAFAGGTARLDVINGGTVDVTDTLIIWDDATIQLAGSTLRAHHIDHRHGGAFEFNSGRLEVADFDGELFNSAGTLAAGPGIAITRVRDDYFQFDGATLEIELAGTDNTNPMLPEYDAVQIDELAILDGTLEVILGDAGGGTFQPAVGDAFEILQAGTLFPGSAFSNTILPMLPSGLGWNVDYDFAANTVTLEVLAVGVSGDFNGDGVFDVADVDALVAEIAGATNQADFDLTDDGAVDQADLTAWLAIAGSANLASGNSYIVGDADLSGAVDVSDFNVWSASKFAQTAAWSQGDFNADGITDASDFNLWNAHKFTSADALRSVPEPAGWVIGLTMILPFWAVRRK